MQENLRAKITAMRATIREYYASDLVSGPIIFLVTIFILGDEDHVGHARRQRADQSTL